MTLETLDAQMEKASKTLATMLDYLGLDASIKAEQKGQKIALVASSEDAGRIIGRKGQSLESLQLLVNRMLQKDNPDFPRVFIDVDGYSRERNPGRKDGGEEREEGDDSPRDERDERDERDDRGGRGGRGRGRGGDRGGRGGDRGGRGRGERNDRRGSDDERAGDNFEQSDERDEALRQQAIDAAKEVKRWGDPVVLPAMNAHDRRIIHITLQEESDLQTESEGDGPKKKVIVSLKK